MAIKKEERKLKVERRDIKGEIWSKRKRGGLSWQGKRKREVVLFFFSLGFKEEKSQKEGSSLWIFFVFLVIRKLFASLVILL